MTKIFNVWDAKRQTVVYSNLDEDGEYDLVWDEDGFDVIDIVTEPIFSRPYYLISKEFYSAKVFLEDENDIKVAISSLRSKYWDYVDQYVLT